MSANYSITDAQIRDVINELSRKCHDASERRGWWYDGKESMYVRATKIALIHSEISEALEGLRKNMMDNHLPHRKSVEVELADALIRIFDLAGALKLDLGGAIEEKMAVNAKRPDHDPENRAKEGGKKV